MSRLVLSDLAHALVCFIGRTIEFRTVNQEPWRRRIQDERRPVIVAFWHNQILTASYYLAARLRRPGIRACAMISASRDGAYLARFLDRFGIGAVRGSTRRGAVPALKGMIERALAGDNLAITPDGPMGPAYRVQPGVMHLARKSGLPVCPLAAAPSRFVTFRSWDRFTLPLPYARAELVFGEPVVVAAEASDEELECRRLDLEHALRAATAEAFARVGRPVPRP